MVQDPEVKKILERYQQRLRKNVNTGKIDDEVRNYDSKGFSREYLIFRKEALNKGVTTYENICNNLEKVVKVSPSKQQALALQKDIEMAHLNITPTGAASFATFIGFLGIIASILLGIMSYLIYHDILKLFLPFLGIFVSVLLIKPLTNIPRGLASKWRLQASNQMVFSILYIVMYMRHTSNLEHALKFATEHVGNPLALDLRKVFWDIETGKYPSLKESLDNYLKTWREHNLEFVNSFHLVQSSLFEPSEDRRLTLLDKALEVMLEGTYERMLHYAQELKNPITMLHMLGVVLPILGLVMFPLIGSFMGGSVKWYHLAILYNIILPFAVYKMGTNVLNKRPTGYGEVSQYTGKSATGAGLAFFIIFLFCIVGLLPLAFVLINYQNDFTIPYLGKFLDIRDGQGPYGIGALLLGLLVPLGIAWGMSIYYTLKTKRLIKLRDETKKLEKEFSGSLFQLGNRIGDGIPAEVAFQDVEETMRGTPTGDFFRIVNVNLRNLGMGLKDALFRPERGALTYYPSALIRSSMEILLESSRKGPQVVARSLTSIAHHVENIHRVDERLKDLLSEIISSMKSQIYFMAPVIAGIVVGIASMVVTIISKLGDLVSQQTTQGGGELGNIGVVTDLFKTQDTIPGYFFQIVVGIYVVQIIYILTILANGIENGSDPLSQQYQLGKNLQKGIMLYFLVTLIVVLLFNALASTILSGLAT